MTAFQRIVVQCLVQIVRLLGMLVLRNNSIEDAESERIWSDIEDLTEYARVVS